MEKATSILSLGSSTYAAKRAADIVFVLLNKEKLDDVSLAKHLNETLKSYGETNEVTLSDLSQLQIVAKKLHAVFAAQDTVRAASLINRLLDAYAHAPRLSNHGSHPWHMHVDSSDHAPWTEWFAASSALALATLLAEKQRNPGGLCASPVCRRPFIDLGKGGGRSYCSPRCATRERVATYRRQHARDAADA